MQQMPCFRIDRHKQRELLAALFDRGLDQQHDCRLVGGGPPTGLTQPFSELLDLAPHRHIRPLDADPRTRATFRNALVS